jgi:hypothetical protein
VLKWAGHVAGMGEMRNAFKILVGKPDRTIPLGRPKFRWEDSISMDLRETGFGGVDWIHLAHNRGQVAGSCEHGNERRQPSSYSPP